MATGARPETWRCRRLHHRARDQPDVRRADRPVVRRRLAAAWAARRRCAWSSSGPAAARLMRDALRAARARAGISSTPRRVHLVEISRAPARGAAAGARRLRRHRSSIGTRRSPMCRRGRRSSSPTSSSMPCRSASSSFAEGWRERVVDLDAATARCASPPATVDHASDAGSSAPPRRRHPRAARRRGRAAGQPRRRAAAPLRRALHRLRPRRRRRRATRCRPCAGTPMSIRWREPGAADLTAHVAVRAARRQGTRGGPGRRRAHHAGRVSRRARHRRARRAADGGQPGPGRRASRPACSA